MTDDANHVAGRILADMRGIWGEMATAMLRKRLRDVCANPAQLTPAELRAIVQLLQEKTLPSSRSSACGRTAAGRGWGGPSSSRR